MARERQCEGADIGANIDRHSARRNVTAQKIQLLTIILGIEQGSALRRADLMMKAETRPLIVDIERSRAEQIDDAGQHRPECTTLQAGSARNPDDERLRGVGSEGSKGGGRRIVVWRQSRVLS